MLAGLDHITLLLNQPHALLALFSERLKLPVAWPFGPCGPFSSGGVFAGNLQFEVVQKESWSASLKSALSLSALTPI
jgi:hypothetical protein